MTYVPGIGYRYQNLANRLGVDYGDVLWFVDILEQTKRRGGVRPALNCWQQRALELPIVVQEAVILEVAAEHDRRRSLAS